MSEIETQTLSSIVYGLAYEALLKIDPHEELPEATFTTQKRVYDAVSDLLQDVVDIEEADPDRWEIQQQSEEVVPSEDLRPTFISLEGAEVSTPKTPIIDFLRSWTGTYEFSPDDRVVSTYDGEFGVVLDILPGGFVRVQWDDSKADGTERPLVSDELPDDLAHSTAVDS